ncbi:MAG: hypothetical protein EWM48_02140 [Sphaerochaeta sp.]|nr:MAG: hypothetical protein EWM48_02140 [Sphaerochaeta sp.]
MKCGIYTITCTANGHFYIGRTSNYGKRIRDHLRDMRNGKHKNPRLQYCFDKYGEDQLLFDLLHELNNRAKQIAVEQELLDKHLDDPKCLNINRSADTFCDVPWTDDRKAKISRSKIGRKMPPMTDEQRRQRSERMMGHRIADETRERISASHKGKNLSDDHRRKIGLGVKGNKNPMFGRRGYLSPIARSVFQVDINTLEITAEYASAFEAARVNNYDSSVISKVCKKKMRQVYGYFWCYSGEYEESLEFFRDSADYLKHRKHRKWGADNPASRAVTQFTKDGSVVAEYACITYVSQIGFDPSCVAKACRGKIQTAYGYRWRYKEGVTTIESN